MNKDIDTVKEYNKALIQKYPFLLPRNRWTDEVDEDYDYSYTEWDMMPKGWNIAFGTLLLDELKEDLQKCNFLNDFRIVEIKEKYGSLRFYTGAIPIESKCDEIIDKYEHLSEHICIKCGKPDVPLIDNHGWTEPLCKECFEKQERERGYKYTPLSYEEAADMADMVIFDSCQDDFSETMDIIRKKAKERSVDSVNNKNEVSIN